MTDTTVAGSARLADIRLSALPGSDLEYLLRLLDEANADRTEKGHIIAAVAARRSQVLDDEDDYPDAGATTTDDPTRRATRPSQMPIRSH